MTKIILAADAATLRAALAASASTATVEAEYGGTVVEGSILTLAHHGSRSANPAPCLYDGQVPALEAIGVSHMDVDALGGVLAILGRRPFPSEFWALVAHSDVHGPHRAADHQAWQAWGVYLELAWDVLSRSRVQAARGEAVDITSTVQKLAGELARIAKLPKAVAETKAAAVRSARTEGVVLLHDVYSNGFSLRVFRTREKFCNDMYRNDRGQVAAAVLALNDRTGAVTLSFEDGGAVLDAAAIMRQVFGEGAGGRRGIAGSPRGQICTLEDLERAEEAVTEAQDALRCQQSPKYRAALVVLLVPEVPDEKETELIPAYSLDGKYVGQLGGEEYYLPSEGLPGMDCPVTELCRRRAALLAERLTLDTAEPVGRDDTTRYRAWKAAREAVQERLEALGKKN